MYPKKKQIQGFTLIELLVVISVIGMLAAIALVATDGGRKQARDVRRISDVEQINLAIQLYYDKFGHFPEETFVDDCNFGWDTSSDGVFIPELRIAGFLQHDLVDPWLDKGGPVDYASCNNGNYLYVHYPAGQFGCPVSKGRFYVLEIIDLDTVPGPPYGAEGRQHPLSPGFGHECAGGGHIWNYFSKYVTGGFEK